MPESQNLEEAFTDLLSTYGRTAHGDGPEAARNLALAENRALEEHLLLGLDESDHAVVRHMCANERTRIEHLGSG